VFYSLKGPKKTVQLNGKSDLNGVLLNPLTALDVYIRPETIAACIGYSASNSQNFEKLLFSIEEKICYKMVYNTLLLG